MDLWHKDGFVQKIHHEYDPPFYLHLPDPDLYHELLEALEEHYRAEPCTFTTIFGECEGYAVFAGRQVAEAIEQQTQFAAQLFNVGRATRPAFHGRTGNCSLLCRSG